MKDSQLKEIKTMKPKEISGETSPCQLLSNESGFVLVASLMFLLILTLFGIFATTTTTLELRIAGNDRFAKQNFYNQEASLVNGQLRYEDWLPTLLAGSNTAFFPPPPVTTPTNTDQNGNGVDDAADYVDSNGNVVGSYKVRKVVATATNVTGWDDAGNYANAADHPANQLPLLDYKDKPPVGSGFGQNLVIARYAITSYSTQNNQNAIVQAGVYKVFQSSNQ